jgi:FMN phosphatase YigB (HAD superfamily)
MGSLPPVRAVLTDGGFILYDDTPGKRAIWQAFVPLAPLSWEEFERRFRPFKDRTQTDAGYSLARAVGDMAVHLGLPADAISFVRPRPVPRPGIPGTLARLRDAKIPVIVVSDSVDSRERLLHKYQDVLGLAGLLTDIVSSVDVGAQKPDPVIWRAALERLAAHRGELPADLRSIVFVGHDPVELEGAGAFGFRPMPCYLEGPETARDIGRPEDVLASFTDLPSRIGIAP